MSTRPAPSIDQYVEALDRQVPEGDLRVLKGDLRVLAVYDPRKNDRAGDFAGRYGEPFEWSNFYPGDNLWLDADVGSAPYWGVAVCRAKDQAKLVKAMERASIRVEVYQPERAFTLLDFGVTRVAFLPYAGGWIVASDWLAEALHEAGTT